MRRGDMVSFYGDDYKGTGEGMYDMAG